MVNQIVKSRDGNIWVTTYGNCFYLLKDNMLVKMPYDPEKNLATSHAILEDKNGFFWISTNKGLYKVLESELLKYSLDKKRNVNYYKFTKNNGFNTDEFNGGGNICGSKLANGEFVLASIDGLVFFNPLKIHTYYPKQVYVDRVLKDDTIENFSKTLNLKQTTSRTTIFIDIPYYANINNAVIFAKIHDSPFAKWEAIGKERKYTISNLIYGEYTLTIKVLVADNNTYIYKKINIQVLPYFYQTIWVKIMICLFFTIVLYLMVKWRLNFLKKKNIELEKIIQERTKSLSDSINNLETLKIELRQENELQKKLIGTITHDISTPIKYISLSTEEKILRRKGMSMETVMFFYLQLINPSTSYIILLKR